VLSASNLEGTSTGEDTLILECVGNSAETITDSVSSLGNGVIIGSLDQDGAGEGVLNTFDEGVLVLTEGLFVDNLGETEISLFKVVNGVKLLTTASKGNTLTVSLLASADTEDTGAGQNLEGGGINTLLVDNDKVLVSALADFLLEGDDLADLVVSESSFGSDKFLSLVSVGPEET